jgi:hypothetical protein
MPLTVGKVSPAGRRRNVDAIVQNGGVRLTFRYVQRKGFCRSARHTDCWNGCALYAPRTLGSQSLERTRSPPHGSGTRRVGLSPSARLGTVGVTERRGCPGDPAAAAPRGDRGTHRHALERAPRAPALPPRGPRPCPVHRHACGPRDPSRHPARLPVPEPGGAHGPRPRHASPPLAVRTPRVERAAERAAAPPGQGHRVPRDRAAGT